MNKKVVILLVICLSCIMTACGYRDLMDSYEQVLSGAAIGGRGNRQVQENKPESTVTSSSIMGASVSGTGIHSADNVTSDMQTAQYWIDRVNTPDKILLKADEIHNYNEKIIKQLLADKDAEFYNLDLYGENISGQQLRDMIGKISFSVKPYFIGNEKMSTEQWQHYLDNCNYEEIMDFNAIEYGIVCSRADMRALPTADAITDEQGNLNYDILQSTALAVNEPVLVLHRSKDNEWYYVIAEEYAGWVKQDTIGLFENRSEWQRTKEMEKFLVITGDRIQTKKILGNSLSGDFEFTMGTRLCLAENKEWENKEEITSAYDCYVVKVPVRGEDGKVKFSLLSIPLSQDVSIGYMEYTRANVIRQAFKMLGNPYGWGGMNGERDCSSLIRDVYFCFGFRLPRNSGDMAKIPSQMHVDLTGLSEKQKIEKLKSVSPGTILQIPGHVMIYLGCSDKNYFVISARGGKEQRVMVNDLHACTDNQKTWSEQLTTIIGLE